MSETVAPANRPRTDSVTDDVGYRADTEWRNNFERLAARAAAEPDFYEIAGSGVGARVDEMRAGGWS